MSLLLVSVNLDIHKIELSHSSETWTETKQAAYHILLCTRHLTRRQSSYLKKTHNQMPAEVQISVTILN